MEEAPLSIRECREQAERLVFRAGGWLAVANRMEVTAEHLKRVFNGPVVPAREMLKRLEAMFPVEWGSHPNPTAVSHRDTGE